MVYPGHHDHRVPDRGVVFGGIGTMLAVLLGLRLFPQLARIDRLESMRHV